MSELIFPENWPEERRKLEYWKELKIQQNICPKCLCYTYRFSGDGICQFCEYEVKK